MSEAELDWLSELETVLPKIQSIAGKCGAEYRSLCFEAVLKAWLAESKRSIAQRVGPSEAPAQVTRQPGTLSLSRNPRFEHFVQNNKLTLEQVRSVVDLESGHVIARNLGSSGAERQRRIAALIGLWNASRSGAFEIPYGELISQCKEFNAFDTANMSTALRKTEEAGARVFIKDGPNWKVTVPGEAYVARIVQELNQPSLD